MWQWQRYHLQYEQPLYNTSKKDQTEREHQMRRRTQLRGQVQDWSFRIQTRPQPIKAQAPYTLAFGSNHITGAQQGRNKREWNSPISCCFTKALWMGLLWTTAMVHPGRRSTKAHPRILAVQGGGQGIARHQGGVGPHASYIFSREAGFRVLLGLGG